MSSNKARRLDPPHLRESTLTGRVYVVTVGRQLPNGLTEATTKYDVTDQFDALAAERRGRENEGPDA